MTILNEEHFFSFAGIPVYNDVFNDSDSEDEDDDENEENDENSGNKKSRFDEETILKRREKRIWEEKRAKILFEYSQFSYYGQVWRTFSTFEA